MIVLCYHELSPVETNPWTLSPQKFREQMQILRERGYRVVTLDQIDETSCRDQKTAVISFDDGRKGCVNYALDTLCESSYPACFYICTSFVERTNVPHRELYSDFVTWTEIRAMAKVGHTIGAHAVTHVSFIDLVHDARLRELQHSKAIIEDRLGSCCLDFATPYGYWDSELAGLARECGYLTLSTTVFGVNRSISSKFRLRRWEIKSELSTAEFARTLLVLETRHQEYRILVLPSEAQPSLDGNWAMGDLADYDLVLTSNHEVNQTLQYFGVECLHCDELETDFRGIVQNQDHAAAQLRQRFDIEPGVEVRIQIPEKI